jgi:teichuronic acid exporter
MTEAAAGPESCSKGSIPAGIVPPTPAVEPAEAPFPGPRTGSALDGALLSGIAWTALGKWSTQALTWLSTLIVARILIPEDFGILSMALVYMGLIYLVNDFGLGPAIIQNRRMTPATISKLAGLSIILGALFTALSAALSWPVAAFFSEPALQPVVMALGFGLVMSGIQVVPRSLLTRDLQFRSLAIVDGAQALVGAAGTLVLAFAGLGYWSLILGSLLAKAVATATICAMHLHPIALPTSLRELLPELRFGGHTTLAGVGWYVYGSADAIVIGRLLTTAALGAYGIAATLASAPLIQVSALLSRVTAGIFSAVQGDRELLHRYIHRLLEGQTLIIFPAAAGLALVASDFIPLVLGREWAAAILPLQVLAMTAAFRSLSPILVQALVFTGRPDQNTRITMLGAVTFPPLFVIGSRWGIDGVAVAWFVGFLGIILPAVLYAAKRHLNLSPMSIGRSLLPGLVCTAVMAVAVLLIAAVGSGPSWTLLVAKVGAGVAVYLLALRSLYWDRVASIRAFARGAR